MASSLGGLVVTLALNATEYFTGLTKSEQEAKKFAKRLEKEMKDVGKYAAGAFAVMQGAALAAAYAVDRLVKQAANFQDLEERTGASAEALASFSVAAQVGGISADEIANAMNKLAKNLTGVDDESKAAGAALEALGIPIAEFKKLDPAAQMETLAKALVGFEDGAGKGAVAMALLGKAGAQLLPFLKELGGGIGRQSILTDEQIKKADEYADSQKRAMAQLNLYAQAISIEMIPALTGFVTASKDFIQQLLGIDKVTGDLARDKRIREFAEDAAKTVGTLISALDLLARAFLAVGLTAGAGMAQVAASAKLQFGEAYRIGKEWQADMAKIVDRPLFTTNLDNAFAAQRQNEALKRQEDRGFVPKKKVLDFEGAQKKDGVDKATQEAKRVLDVQLKAQDRSIKLEQDMLKEQEHYLSAAFEDNLISYRRYYAERQRLADEAQKRILIAQQVQVDAAEAFAKRPGLKGADKEAADEKVLALNDKLNETRRAGAMAALDNQRALTKEAQAYYDAVDDVNAQILELKGNLEAAAAIRFEKQHRELTNIFKREGNAAGLGELETLKEQALIRARLTKTSQEYATVQQQLGNEQARIDLAVSSGASTTLDAINKRSEVTRKFIGQLSAKADEAAAAIARMIPGPEQDAAIAGLERMRLEIAALDESANELENTVRHLFVDTFADGFTDVITGTKSVKDAFKDMEKQIVAFLARMAAQNIAESIFGTKSGGSSSSGIIAKFIPFIASLFGGSAAGGLTSTGGGFGEHFASGGPVAANRPAIVGEKGAELFVPRAAGNIIPNDVLSNRRAQRASNVTVNVNVQGSTTRATADQVAVRTGAAVRRALSRNA